MINWTAELLLRSQISSNNSGIHRGQADLTEFLRQGHEHKNKYQGVNNHFGGSKTSPHVNPPWAN